MNRHAHQVSPWSMFFHQVLEASSTILLMGVTHLCAGMGWVDRLTLRVGPVTSG